jgi:hypothetical protein
MKFTIRSIGLTIALMLSAAVFAAPQTDPEEGVTRIHLDEYNGYFSAAETLASLAPGEYEFVVSNKAGKPVGFQIQDLETLKTLDMFPLEPGETRASRVQVGAAGVRYRCPINPTPWYDVDSIKTP